MWAQSQAWEACGPMMVKVDSPATMLVGELCRVLEGGGHIHAFEPTWQHVIRQGVQGSGCPPSITYRGLWDSGSGGVETQVR